MADEEYLRTVHVRELRPLNGPIQLAEYNPEWPALFLRQAQRIRNVLGERVIMLEHVGSTSVRGLAAKPIIDMLLAVPDSADEQAYIPAMEAASYVLHIREPQWHEHRLFKGSDLDVNLHVFSHGSSEIERMLLFRDWLRSHDSERELYERTKRTLAKRVWQYTQDYADAKATVVEEILTRARAAT